MLCVFDFWYDIPLWGGNTMHEIMHRDACRDATVWFFDEASCFNEKVMHIGT